MTPDKALEEICAVRQQISEIYGHDVKVFLEHYRELERQYQERLVGRKDAKTRPPKAPEGADRRGGA
jgi:hypothetical protein